jgi:hypothetical protein
MREQIFHKIDCLFLYFINYTSSDNQQSKTMNCSREMNNSRGMNNKAKTADKKYCGVCHKAGKPASEYESHYTKSVPGPTGIVTCPLILASVCNRCGKSGHFSDHCSLKKPLPPKNNRLSAAPAAPAPAPVRRYANAYAALAADDDDEEVVMPVVKQQPKIKVEKEIASLAPNGVSFAAMLLKPAPAPVVETGFKISPKLQTLLATEEKSEKVLLAEKIIAERSTRKHRSWAELSDDEDEDEEW